MLGETRLVGYSSLGDSLPSPLTSCCTLPPLSPHPGRDIYGQKKKKFLLAKLHSGGYDSAYCPRGSLKLGWGVEVAGPEGEVELGSWGSLSLWQSGCGILEPEHLALRLLCVLDGLLLCSKEGAVSVHPLLPKHCLFNYTHPPRTCSLRETQETLCCQTPDPIPTPSNSKLPLPWSWFHTTHYHRHPRPGSSPPSTVDLLVFS